MYRRRGLTAAIVLMLVAALGLSVVGGATGAKKKKKVVKATATLNGANEVPPADPDGTGTADFKLKRKKGRPNGKVCFDVSFQNIGAPHVAHIHPGAAGVNGPPFIFLFESTTGGTFTSPQSDCVKAPKSQVKQVSKNPDQFYINIHNEEFPDGAIRGQLEKTSGGGGGGGGGGTLPPGY
jgi:hypothetical protein